MEKQGREKRKGREGMRERFETIGTFTNMRIKADTSRKNGIEKGKRSEMLKLKMFRKKNKIIFILIANLINGNLFRVQACLDFSVVSLLVSTIQAVMVYGADL